MSQEVARRLNFIRYGLVAVTVVVLAITLVMLVPFASAGLMGWGEVLWRAALYTAVAAAVCSAVYMGYKSVAAKG